jgi:hypothetical protein
MRHGRTTGPLSRQEHDGRRRLVVLAHADVAAGVAHVVPNDTIAGSVQLRKCILLVVILGGIHATASQQQRNEVSVIEEQYGQTLRHREDIQEEEEREGEGEGECT